MYSELMFYRLPGGSCKQSLSSSMKIRCAVVASKNEVARTTLDSFNNKFFFILLRDSQYLKKIKYKGL